MNKIFLLSVLSMVFVSGCVGQTETPPPLTTTTTPTTQTTATTQTTTTTQTPTTTTTPTVNTVEITSSGFNPNTLTINAGDTVTFMNKDTRSHWPASAVHPTHAVYPEPGGCTGSKFDACRDLLQGESWSFTFNQIGTWKYHDHLSPGLTGTIIVQ